MNKATHLDNFPTHEQSAHRKLAKEWSNFCEMMQETKMWYPPITPPPREVAAVTSGIKSEEEKSKTWQAYVAKKQSEWTLVRSEWEEVMNKDVEILDDTETMKTSKQVGDELEAAKRARQAERKAASDIVLDYAKQSLELKKTMHDFYINAQLIAQRDSRHLAKAADALSDFVALAKRLWAPPPSLPPRIATTGSMETYLSKQSSEKRCQEACNSSNTFNSSDIRHSSANATTNTPFQSQTRSQQHSGGGRSRPVTSIMIPPIIGQLWVAEFLFSIFYSVLQLL
jgi:hypothetical protein